MTVEFPAVNLAHYAEKIGYSDCAFFGISVPDDIHSCRTIWTHAERQMIYDALLEAQDEIEQEIRYFLVPKWATAERHNYACPMLTKWGHVISGGVMLDTMLDAGVAPNYGADPAVISANVGSCAAANIHVFHAGTDTEITPISISVAGGVATISIPWCRLVDPDYEDNPPEGWQYSDVATWSADTVDVHCITNSLATQATLIWRVSDNNLCTMPGCSDHRHSGCIYVREPEIGSVDVRRAAYSGGVWTATNCTCSCYSPNWVELNYYSGLTTLTRQAEDTVIRLAHSKMPNEPCGCQATQRLWARDRHFGDVMTRERINCPFGESDGAWFSWRQAQTMKLVRASVL